MKHETVIQPTTNAVTTTSAVTDPVTRVALSGVSADVNATEEDKVLFVVNGPATGGIVNPLAGAETVLIYVVSSNGSMVPVYDNAGVQAQLNNAASSVMVEGGFIYRLVKTVTAAVAGVDVYLKPRR